VQIISLFHHLRFVIYKRLLSNTRHDLKGRRGENSVPSAQKTEFKSRTIKVKGTRQIWLGHQSQGHKRPVKSLCASETQRARIHNPFPLHSKTMSNTSSTYQSPLQMD